MEEFEDISYLRLEVNSDYNKIQKDMPDWQIEECKGCEYRSVGLQFAVANAEARKFGGSPKKYLQGFYPMYTDIPSCFRETCLLDGLEIRRGASSPPCYDNLFKSKSLERDRRGIK